ncbi:hypothetical protein BGZ63DRAFT_405123 [Mariannaea sp. PMI_226]|nr:hypothetical protein BGZ63DRAFT_405123 [Mariannaea sp. PMI_226]
MLPTLGIATIAVFLSGTHAAVPRLHPRLDSASDMMLTTTPAIFTTPGAGSTPPPFFPSRSTLLSSITTDGTTVGTPIAPSNPVDTPIAPSNPVDTTIAPSNSVDIPVAPSNPAGPSTIITSLTSGSNDGTTTSGGIIIIITTASASLLTTTQATKTGAFIAVNVGATSASGTFTNLAAAASSLAANPSPSPEEVQIFNQQANDNKKQLSALQDEVKGIDKSKLNDNDSHKVEESLLALAALLAWYGPKLSALGPVAATPALALPVLTELAPAFAAAAVAGGLLSKAVDDLFDLGEDDGKGDDGPTNTKASQTKESTASSSIQESSTSEASTTTSEALSCSSITYYPDLVPPEDNELDSGGNLKRSITGGVEIDNGLLKRADPPKLGSCELPERVNIPSYPNAKAVYNSLRQPAKQDTFNYRGNILRWYQRTTCPDSIQKVNDADAEKAPNGGIASFNTDHVFELKLLGLYFSYYTPGGKDPQLTCDDFRSVFFPGGNMANLQALFNLLPSRENPEFMIVTKNINSIKGRMFMEGQLEWDRWVELWHNNLDMIIQNLQDLGIAASVFKRSEVQMTFEKTNQRIYNHFVETDRRISGCGMLSNPEFRFADTYQAFMVGQLGRAGGYAWNFVKTWKSVVEKKLAPMEEGDEKTRITKLYQDFLDSPYNSEAHYNFPANNNLAAGAPAAKRQDGGQCTLNLPTKSLTDIPNTSGQPANPTAMPVGQSTSEGSATTSIISTMDELPTTPTTATALTTMVQWETTVVPQTTVIQQTTVVSQATVTGPTNPATKPITTAAEATTTPGFPSDTPTIQPDLPSTTSTSAVDPISTRSTFSTSVLTSQAPPPPTELATQTQNVPDAQTITTNGMVCTLIRGSNNPVCTPLYTNTAGTNVHVNTGCITIDSRILCEGDDAYNVANQGGPTSKVTIYAKFPGDNTADYLVSPGCELQAELPSDYGDVYFGEDNCLYDSSGNQINGQCCQNQGTTQVKNPYFDHLFGSRTKCGPGTDSDKIGQSIGQQCVRIWVDPKAGGQGWDAEFKIQSPNNCDGTCWSWPAGFSGIETIGDGTHGTNCQTFSDLNCKEPIVETGNAVEHHNAVLAKIGHSVQCYFNC